MPAFPVPVSEPLFVLADAAPWRAFQSVLRRLPAVAGEPICLERVAGLRDRHGPVHAGSFIRERRIAFDCSAAEFPRIFAHEAFHFVWVRAGNRRRREWEELLAAELRKGVRGELGWSAEWRKRRLSAGDVTQRTRRWREYCCEAFSDTAAWLYSGVDNHPEYTLSAACRASRRAWLEWFVAGRVLPL